MKDQENQKRVAGLVQEIISLIPGINLEDPNLKGTPDRIARMYLNGIFKGLDPSNFPKMTAFPVDGEVPGLVGTGKLFFSSVCAHHFLPFVGYAHIFYVPDKLILGVSKFARLVNYYAARPQIQERLGVQIAEAIMRITKCHGCYVVLRATHTCMQARGVRQEGSVMVTPTIRPIDNEGLPSGPFAKAETRNEALALMEMEK